MSKLRIPDACHTQCLEAKGCRGKDPWLPRCLGHEASGVVVDIGSDVTRAAPSDRVALSWIKAKGIEAGGSTYDWAERTVNAGAVKTGERTTVLRIWHREHFPGRGDGQKSCVLPPWYTLITVSHTWARSNVTTEYGFF